MHIRSFPILLDHIITAMSGLLHCQLSFWGVSFISSRFSRPRRFAFPSTLLLFTNQFCGPFMCRTISRPLFPPYRSPWGKKTRRTAFKEENQTNYFCVSEMGEMNAITLLHTIESIVNAVWSFSWSLSLASGSDKIICCLQTKLLYPILPTKRVATYCLNLYEMM